MIRPAAISPAVGPRNRSQSILVLARQLRCAFAALLRSLAIAALALGPGGIGHGMAFVEKDDPVEIRPEPVDDPVDAGFPGPALFRAQRRIGGE